jgi:hypothetical protein
MKGRSRRKPSADALDVGQPIFVKTVGQVTVVPVIGKVAGKDQVALGLEHPNTVLGRLPRSQVRDCECDLSERQRLSVGDLMVGESTFVSPLIAEHRAKDLLLDRVVATDHLGEPCDGEHGNVMVANDLDQATVVIGMGVSDDDAEKWRSEVVNERPEGTAVGDGERRVDDNGASWALDYVRVDRSFASGGGKAVDEIRWHARTVAGEAPIAK